MDTGSDKQVASRVSSILSTEVSRAGLYSVLSWMFWLMALVTLVIGAFMAWRFGLGGPGVVSLVFLSIVAVMLIAAGIVMRVMSRRPPAG